MQSIIIIKKHVSMQKPKKSGRPPPGQKSEVFPDEDEMDTN